MSNTSLMRYRKPKGLIGRIQQVILHPVLFFKSLEDESESRAWLWTALLTLTLLGYSAVRRESLIAEATGLDTDVQGQVILAITAAFTIITSWIIQILFLGLVSMLQGQKPLWSLNLRIAIWASLPLLLMAIVQLAYMTIGGNLISMSALANDALPADETANEVILLSHFFRQITIFNLWRMVLFFLGASYSLNSARWLAALLTLLSFASLFLIPTFWQMIFGG